MKALLKDHRIVRLLIANSLGSIGSGVTIFAVPWLLVQEPGGAAAYRHITLFTTVILFLFMPWYGSRVDRSSRKSMVLASDVFGAGATAIMAVWVALKGDAASTELMAIYFCGMLYYTLHYPAKWAMVQQLFDRSQYQQLTGLMEVQGQAAMLAAGALGGLAVSHLPLWSILAINCVTYCASFLVQRPLPYTPTHLTAATGRGASPVRNGGMLQRIHDGWTWLASRPRLAWFFTFTLMPFVLVMAGNYLVPVYVNQTLHAGPGIFAVSEIMFAMGAVAAGLVLPRLIAQHHAYATLPFTMAVFLAGLCLQAALPYTATFVVAMMLLGFGNAGCRVARSALILNLVPNEVMGRITVFYSVLDRLARTLVVGSMAVVDVWGARSGFAILVALMTASLAGALFTRRAIPPTAA